VPTHARTVTQSVTVPHEGHGVSLARHAFAKELASAGVSDEVRQDAVLVMSELVSNAVKHGAPLPDGQVRVRWLITDESVHVEITDGGAVTRPNPAVATVFALGGRGLDIVRLISREWGVTQDGDSVTVWADVPRVRKQIGEPRAEVVEH
jgi:serine/threonine-protein kinase RsbW